MAELDPIVAEILLKGDDEILESFQRIGEQASESLEKIRAAAENGGSGLQAFTGYVGLVEVAVSAATAAVVAFIEQQTELSQATQLLANAFGITASQLQGLEANFASSGVKVEQFERFATRLTTTIAREWPQIAESVKNYANENDSATLRISNAILAVRDAQNRLADNSAEATARAAKDNDALEASYIKLQFAAVHAASEQRAAYLSIQGAALSVTAAEQHLAELQGRPPSEADKQNLQMAQAQAAVDNARKAEADARVAAQEKAANAALKQRQLEAENDDLARRAAKNARDDADQRQKDENAVQAAILARGEAEEKAAKLALTNITSIKGALDGIVSGNKSAATQIDLTAVSVDNLTKGIVAQAAASAKGTTPTGYETLRTISNLLAKDTDHLISTQTRLALVTRLAGSQMQAMGKSAAEILDVLEHDSEEIGVLTDKTDAFGKAVPPDTIEKFRGALASLNLAISQLSQSFAAAAAPAFTAFLNTLKSSLQDANGTLHLIIDGFKAVGGAVSAVVGEIVRLGAELEKSFNLAPGRSLQILLAALAAAVVVFGGAWTAIPAAIALAVTALGFVSDHMKDISNWIEDNRVKFVALGGVIAGIAVFFAPWTVAIGLIIAGVVLLYEHWDDVKKAISDAWSAFKDTSVVKFLSGVYDGLSQIVKLAASLLGFGKGSSSGASTSTPSNTNATTMEAGNANTGLKGLATGGAVNGPGTGTSDSILARLSNGEFVMKAAAVQAYGTKFFNSLNNMQVPGFAQGGIVSPSDQSGSGFSSKFADWAKGRGGDYATLNLSIDGRSFSGLKGPKNTIDDLSSFAIARQTSSAGAKPSWLK